MVGATIHLKGLLVIRGNKRGCSRIVYTVYTCSSNYQPHVCHLYFPFVRFQLLVHLNVPFDSICYSDEKSLRACLSCLLFNLACRMVDSPAYARFHVYLEAPNSKGPEKVLQTSACRGQNQWPAPSCWTPSPPLNINFSFVNQMRQIIELRGMELNVKTTHLGEFGL